MSFNADTVLGALLVGTWANSVLYTVEVIQAAYYYRHFKHDNWMLKLLVLSAITIDSVSITANYAAVYLYTISHWGDLAYLQNQYWASHFGPIGRNINRTHVIKQPVPLHVFTSGVMAALAQSFLAARYWLLTRNKFITFTFFFLITVATGGAFASAVTLATFPEYKDRRKVVIPATLLNRLVAQTIQTGTAGATIALAVLVSFLANKESNVTTGIAYCLGRVYCITMLANLNRRKTGDTWSSSGVSIDTRGELGNQERTEGGNDYGGIHVHRTAVVHIDTPQEFSIGSFKTNPGQGLPDDSPAIEIEMTVNNSASYSSKNKQDLFTA
ncbi:hypothetical protein B0H13DRAFT_2537862 [Mycena leptocephala]|nr:hypothetical protein B0H13DRAFT_2537862 [Mycena leptocephala]